MVLTSVSPGAAGGAQALDGLISPGPLAAVHAELTGLRNCTSCHAPGQGVSDDKCLACHEDLGVRVRALQGFHRDKSECAVCHSDHQGEAFDLVRWDIDTFDHEETGYPLLGLHRNVSDCLQCHQSPNAPVRTSSTTYLLNDNRCIACHTDVHQGQLGEDCSQCHGLESPFEDVAFDHSRTAFTLVGAHQRVPCERCHPNQKWKGLAFATCTSCHEDAHQPSLGNDCTKCHSEESWDSYSVDHDRTRFPLLGKHDAVECDGCHVNDVFRGLEFENCADCHTDDTHYGQFTDDCGSCHAVEGFETVTNDHDATRYPLTGRHFDEVTCEQCHVEEVDSLFPAGLATAVRYTPLETKCRACHVDAHYGQLTNTCEACHVTDGFRDPHVLFEHNRDASFQLLGKHTDATCEQCHRLERGPFPGGSGLAVRYKPISDSCLTCHDNVHDEAWWRDSSSTLQTDCAQCHGPETFALESFDHDRTSFALTGAHVQIDCETCHDFAVSGEHEYLLFQEVSTDCVDCHATPHMRGMERCVDCHSTTTWQVGD